MIDTPSYPCLREVLASLKKSWGSGVFPVEKVSPPSEDPSPAAKQVTSCKPWKGRKAEPVIKLDSDAASSIF